MHISTWAILACIAKSHAGKGHPLYFASYNEVGNNEIQREPVALEDADSLLTSWLDSCNSDAYVIVKDSSPFDREALEVIEDRSKVSLTRGSFLTDYLINTYELAEDISNHCKAEMIKVNVKAEIPYQRYVDKNPRVFYVEFEPLEFNVDKNEILRNVIGGVPSAAVTIIYTSSFQAGLPIYQDIEIDPRRREVARSQSRPRVTKVADPLPPPRLLPISAKVEVEYQPNDNLALSISVFSAGIVVLLLLRSGLVALVRRTKEEKGESKDRKAEPKDRKAESKDTKDTDSTTKYAAKDKALDAVSTSVSKTTVRKRA